MYAMQIDQLVKRLVKLKPDHVFRDDNMVADKLAQMAYRYNRPMVWKHEIPVDIWSPLAADYKASKYGLVDTGHSKLYKLIDVLKLSKMDV